MIKACAFLVAVLLWLIPGEVCADEVSDLLHARNPVVKEYVAAYKQLSLEEKSLYRALVYQNMAELLRMQSYVVAKDIARAEQIYSELKKDLPLYERDKLQHIREVLVESERVLHRLTVLAKKCSTLQRHSMFASALPSDTIFLSKRDVIIAEYVEAYLLRDKNRERGASPNDVSKMDIHVLTLQAEFISLCDREGVNKDDALVLLEAAIADYADQWNHQYETDHSINDKYRQRIFTRLEELSTETRRLATDKEVIKNVSRVADTSKKYTPSKAGIVIQNEKPDRTMY